MPRPACFGASFPALEWLTAGRTNVLGFPLPHSVVALIIVTAVAWVVLHRSVFGRYLYAVGKNEEAARYSGIRANRVVISAYIICGGLTAFSAILIAMYTRSTPAVHGSFYESTPSPPPCSVAARCAVARARSWAFCSALCCSRYCKTSSTCWAFRARSTLL
jgi:ABC-type glucose/galactose transport system permease subunit